MAKATETALHFDPWRTTAPPSRTRPEPSRAPVAWRLLSNVGAGVIGGAAVMVLRAHPDRTRPRDGAYLVHRIREKLWALRDAGDGAARTALGELQSAELNNPLMLGEVVAKLLEAGDLVAMLREQRAALDGEITRLERLDNQPTHS